MSERRNRHQKKNKKKKTHLIFRKSHLNTHLFTSISIIPPYFASRGDCELMINRYILLLYNYSFHSPEINQCLYHYFNTLYVYIDEESNATGDEKYDDYHQEEIQSILRPRLYCVVLLEIFNRIMHDPGASHDTGMNRSDIENLGSLGRKIVIYINSD